MNLKPFTTNKLNRVIYLVIFIITAAVCLSVYTSFKVRGLFIENSKKLLTNNIFLLKQTVDQFYSQTLDNVSANFLLFHENIYNNGSFAIKQDETVRQKALNQITGREKEIDLPLMYYNNEPVLQNFALVDHIVNRVKIEGLTTTIFQVIDDGILRITTNVKTLKDERAIGTYIPSDSPVYKTVMAKNIYRGRAYVVNQWYWTVYEPIIVNGEVIGVLYMGIKESVLLKVLKKTFEAVKVGQVGYAFLLDSKGSLIIHPFNEGEKVDGFISEDGVDIFKELTKRKQGWLEYMYPKPNKSGSYKKLTRFMAVDELGWVVGAGVYEDELYEDFINYEIIYAIFVILLLTVVGSFITINFFNINRKLIANSKELKKLAMDAENANMAKSVFLANMSHEIRTPLNSIIGFSEILSDASLPPKEKEYAETITKSANSLLTIINDILDISKIESGTVDIIEEAFNIRTLIDTVVKMFSMRAKENRIRFVFLYNTDIPVQVYGDPARLQQVLVNLLGNAIKFTPAHGEVTLSVFPQNSRAERVNIAFEIKDTGIGISEDALQDIFRPFSQADSGINRQYGGTGLGLTICEKLLGMMNSKITVESLVGKGTTFRFSLEMKCVPENEFVQTFRIHNRTEIKTVPENIYKGLVLVAEDNRTNQMLMKIILEKLGLNVDFVKNGQEVLDYCLTKTPDLILMDINMPIMDGMTSYTRLKEFRYQQGKSYIPVVALTANAIKGDQEKYLSAGMDDYLSKPLEKKELIRVLNRFITDKAKV